MNLETLRFGLEISLIGMGVVFLGLLLVTGAITAMRRLDERWQAAERRGEADGPRGGADHRFDDPGADRGGGRNHDRRPPPDSRRAADAAWRERRLGLVRSPGALFSRARTRLPTGRAATGARPARTRPSTDPLPARFQHLPRNRLKTR